MSTSSVLKGSPPAVPASMFCPRRLWPPSLPHVLWGSSVAVVVGVVATICSFRVADVSSGHLPRVRNIESRWPPTALDAGWPMPHYTHRRTGFGFTRTMVSNNSFVTPWIDGSHMTLESEAGWPFYCIRRTELWWTDELPSLSATRPRVTQAPSSCVGGPQAEDTVQVQESVQIDALPAMLNLLVYTIVGAGVGLVLSAMSIRRDCRRSMPAGWHT